jgi:hypothetical protein
MTHQRRGRGFLSGALLGALVVFGTASASLGAPKPDLWPRWEANDPKSTAVVDHTPWGAFLRKYLVADHPSGINRVRYGAVTPEDRRSLDEYVSRLAATHVAGLNRAEQKAFWINLYNALTVRVILERYPVKSIRDIRLGGIFSSGPWDAKLVTIEGEKISLNDIEHRILRPIWRDNRIHYAVNCASLGCPNLAPEPFTAASTDRLLDEAARAYVNHPRGVAVEGKRLTASSIYDWYRDDFARSESELLVHFGAYAAPPLAAALAGFDGSFRYHYDWSLNE